MYCSPCSIAHCNSNILTIRINEETEKELRLLRSDLFDRFWHDRGLHMGYKEADRKYIEAHFMSMPSADLLNKYMTHYIAFQICVQMYEQNKGK